jgi:hypothetical protein
MDQLVTSIIHVDFKEGVVVINKPNGIPLHPSDDCNFSLTDTLNDLAAVIDVKHLKPFKVPPRY